MAYVSTSTDKRSNAQSTFTDLFSILNQYIPSRAGDLTLRYSYEELNTIKETAQKNITLLDDGIQELRSLLNSISKINPTLNQNLNNTNSFIEGITNLIEALSNLESDACYVLENNL